MSDVNIIYETPPVREFGDWMILVNMVTLDYLLNADDVTIYKREPYMNDMSADTFVVTGYWGFSVCVDGVYVHVPSVYTSEAGTSEIDEKLSKYTNYAVYRDFIRLTML